MPIYIFQSLSTEAFVIVQQKGSSKSKNNVTLQFARWNMVDDSFVFDTRIHDDANSLKLHGCTLHESGKSIIICLACHKYPNDWMRSYLIDTETFEILKTEYTEMRFEIPPLFLNGNYQASSDRVWPSLYNKSDVKADSANLKLQTGEKSINYWSFQTTPESNFIADDRGRIITTKKKHPYSIFIKTKEGLETSINLKELPGFIKAEKPK